MGQTTSAADSYRRLRASMLECVTVDMDTGGRYCFRVERTLAYRNWEHRKCF